MEMNKNVYLVISLIGLVFAILSNVSNYGMDTTLTILYLTIALILFLHLISEYNYYKSYKAPLASAIFLLIPSFIAIAGSYVSRSPAINGKPFFADNIMYTSLNVSFFPINPLIFYTNTFSVIFAFPFYIILLILLYRYYFGIYPRLFIMRKKFYKIFAMYYNIILIGLLSFIWLSTKVIDLFELIFVILSIFFIIRTYVFKIVFVPVRVVPSRRRRTTPRRSYTSPNDSINRTTPNRSTSNNTSSPQRTIPSLNTINPRSNASTPARQNYRPQTPVRARTTSPRGHGVEVVPGIDLSSSPRNDKKSKITKDQVKQMIPIAQNLTQDDFRCIFCYELPIKSSDQVVICPNCKKPAHYPEYQKWTAYSNFCSYCNQDIGNRTPKRVSGKNYKNIIAYALKK